MRSVFSGLLKSRAGRNVAASYFAFVSVSACAFLTIPIAVSYLTEKQMGLWTIVNGVIGYLLWLDLGVGDATGRKMAESIAKNDLPEIRKWWTTSIIVLAGLGMVMIAAALLGYPFLVSFLRLGPEDAKDAAWLFIGSAVAAGLAMPVRAYPGILLAQQRFHWVPVVQGTMPWIQLCGFYLCLRSGLGVRSYFWSVLASQLFGWSTFMWQVHGNLKGLRLDLGGATRERLRSLLGFSGSIMAYGIGQALLQGLPGLLLGRMGGLHAVPTYTFSSRGPSMLLSLAGRMTHAFYPNLQRLYVEGNTPRFRAKFQAVSRFAIAIGTASAGAVIAGNRPLVELLTGGGFYAGVWTNAWLAVAVVITPLVTSFVNLLQYSGSMGKTGAVALGGAALAAAFAIGGYSVWGMPGLAAAFALAPGLVMMPYALFRGARNTGFRARDAGGAAVLWSGLSILLVLISAAAISASHPESATIGIFGREIMLPTMREAACGAVLILAGLIQALRMLPKIKSA